MTIRITPKTNGGVPGVHAPTHENGGADEVSIAGLSGLAGDAQTPLAHDISGSAHTGTLPHASTSGKTANDHHNQAHAIDGVDHTGTLPHASTSGQTTDDHHAQLHAATHQNGGGDEINVAGLSGELADDQPPKDHAATHVTGGGDTIADAIAAGNSGLMSGADKTKLDGMEALADVTANNAPQGHHGSHENGGTDEISVTALSGLLADDQHVLDTEVRAAINNIIGADGKLDATLDVDGHDITGLTDLEIYDATNDGNPVISLGSSVSDALTIQSVYDVGAQKLSHIKIDTRTTSGAGTPGVYHFSMAGVEKMTIAERGVYAANLLFVQSSDTAPSEGDIAGQIALYGYDDAATPNKVEYGGVYTQIMDKTSGSEYGKIVLDPTINGSGEELFALSDGTPYGIPGGLIVLGGVSSSDFRIALFTGSEDSDSGDIIFMGSGGGGPSGVGGGFKGGGIRLGAGPGGDADTSGDGGDGGDNYIYGGLAGEEDGGGGVDGAEGDVILAYNPDEATLVGAVRIGELAGPGITLIKTDLAGNVDTSLVTQKAVKTAVDAKADRFKAVTTVNVANYDLLLADDILHVTRTAAGTCAIDWKTAQMTSGRYLVIKDASGNASAFNITLTTEGGQTIDGQATAVITGDYDSITVYCNGSDLFVV